MSKRRKGEGSISYQPSRNRYIGQITVEGIRKTKTHNDKKVVLNWLTEQREKIRLGTYTADESETVESFITSYMEGTMRHNLRPRTFEAHSGYIKNHIIPELGKIKLVSLRPDHVQSFYDKKINEGLAPRTVQYMHSILRKTLQQALKWGLVARNVCDLVDRPKLHKTTPLILTPQEIDIFLDAVKEHKYYPLYVLAVYTGMRQSEIIGLHVSDVDLSKGTIQVKRNVQWVRGRGFTVMDVKTETSKRLIPLPAFALEVLRKYLATEPLTDSPYLFVSSKNNPVYSANLYRHFAATLKEMGLPHVTFHSLRHFHASVLMREGVNPKVVQERLGHSSVAFTLNIYSHTVPSMGKEAAEKFNEALKIL